MAAASASGEHPWRRADAVAYMLEHHRGSARRDLRRRHRQELGSTDPAPRRGAVPGADPSARARWCGVFQR